VDTIAAAHKARLEGVVVEEDGVMVLDLAAVERAADEMGLFFWVRRP
ncbi:MAG: UDP-2,3-diacylglucosamine diphosphatase LpxI, partial [Silicimonas sp.]|nr:UDP-2,3-diacylglucosamine diphosphatase LpxI [Silicimonas sp.]